MSTAPTDLYTIPMDELRRLAETATVTPESVTPGSESESAATPDPEQTLPPRDERGRFVSPEATLVDDAEEQLVDPVEDPAAPVEEYTATIDIGDGAGVQVFSAPTKDELLAKLIEAQENATRKIRELSTKKPEPVKPVETAPTPDEELALAQEFLANPHKAFDRLYQQRREEERQREAEAQRQAAEAAKAVDAAAKQFIQSNPDYYEHPKNAARIEGWLKLNGNLDPTVENITAAFNDLKADGLLLSKPEAEPVRTARASGISVRRSAAPPLNAGKDPSKMTLEELREAAGGYIYK